MSTSPYLPGRIGSGFATPFNYYRPAISGYSGLYPYPQLYTPYGAYFTGGGFVTSGYGYGYGYSPYFVVPGAYGYDQPAVEEPPASPGRVVELSNEYPATLTLEFPAAAKVWLDGKAVEGEAGTVRELNSPVLKTGQTYTFKVKAQWDVKGKSYEYTREVTLGSGDRSKLLVMSGTPVAEK
jgi:uncharacterized protein (TIGR03000 family)